MKFTVYILYSANKNRYYVGHTEDVNRRLIEHNTRKNLGANDWIIKHQENFDNRAAAMAREHEIKSRKKRSYIEGLFK